MPWVNASVEKKIAKLRDVTSSDELLTFVEQELLVFIDREGLIEQLDEYLDSVLEEEFGNGKDSVAGKTY